MIVVVVMAILAAVVLPQFGDSAKDAKTSGARYNLHSMREQLEYYRMQHDGKHPSSLNVLTLRSNAAGNTGTGAEYRFGPYLTAIPKNPFTDGTLVTPSPSNPPTSATGADDAGWLYHAASGGVWIDHPDLFDE